MEKKAYYLVFRYSKWLEGVIKRSVKNCINLAGLSCYSLIRCIKGDPAKHVVISGFSRSGTTLLYNMMRYSIGEAEVYAPGKEVPALATISRFKRRIITKRPLDIFLLGKIERKLGRHRELVHLIVIRDPRDLVSSFHQSVPNQYFQAVDYQLLVRPGFHSFTGPGIGLVYEAVRAQESNPRALVIRYEDIVGDPEQVRDEVQAATKMTFSKPFSGFHESEVPDELTVQLNGVRPVKRQKRPPWTIGTRLDRFCEQIDIFPELESMAVRLGYDPIKKVKKNLDLSLPKKNINRGLIIACHTDDELYSKEAERCRRQIDSLGLQGEFKIIQNNLDWFHNCAQKPEFLLEMRRRRRGKLLYIDVDGFVHRDPWPYLNQFNGDLAIYIHSDGSIQTRTILINDTKAAEVILEKWVSRQKENPGTYGQQILQEMVRHQSSEVAKWDIRALPPNLSYIFGDPSPAMYGTPMIEYFQAGHLSRFGARGNRTDARISELTS